MVLNKIIKSFAATSRDTRRTAWLSVSRTLSCCEHERVLNFVSQQITYSYFSNCLDIHPAQYLTTWPDFARDLAAEQSPRHADDRTKKYATPLISPAAYDLGTRRKDVNVIGWGGWMGLDIDNDGMIYTPFEMAVTEIETLGVNAMIYTTTKATAACHRFRILLHLSRDLSPEEIKSHHAAVCRMFDKFAPDPSCKDISRIYTAPSTWTPSEAGNTEPVNMFWSRTDGVPLDIDAVLADHPPEASAPLPQSFPPSWNGAIVGPAIEKVANDRPATLRPLPLGRSILKSPVVTANMVEEYINGPKGSHHVGLYRFMTRVAARAAVMEFEISVDDLVGFAREVDAVSPIKTSAERWSRIHAEAERALACADRSSWCERNKEAPLPTSYT